MTICRCRCNNEHAYVLIMYHSSTDTSSWIIWLEDVFCEYSTYNCIANCASCPSAEYHNRCVHSKNVTIECSEFRNSVAQCYYLMIGVSTITTAVSTGLDSCNGVVDLHGMAIYSIY